MTITIKQLLNYSWMSQASYLDFNGLIKNDSSDNLVIKLKANNTRGQSQHYFHERAPIA